MKAGWVGKEESVSFVSEKAGTGIFTGGNDMSGIGEHFTQLLWE